jgi:hypothetical protein
MMGQLSQVMVVLVAYRKICMISIFHLIYTHRIRHNILSLSEQFRLSTKTYILEMPISNPGQDADYPKLFLFSQSVRDNAAYCLVLDKHRSILHLLQKYLLYSVRRYII